MWIQYTRADNLHCKNEHIFSSQESCIPADGVILTCVVDFRPRLRLSGYSSLLAFSKTTSIKRLSIHTPLKNDAKQMRLDKPDIPFLNFTSSNSTQPHIHETNQISPASTSSQVTQPDKASRCLREPLPSERKEGCS
jgi:hypothetical protein